MEDNKTLISILNFNGSKDTIDCIQSFYKYEEKEKYCIVVWDNDSNNQEKQILIEKISNFTINFKICTPKEYLTLDLIDYNLVLVLSDVNLGFAKGNNEVIRNQLNKFQYIVLLNNDTEFIKDTTSILVNYLKKNNAVGVVTSSIFYYYNKKAIWNAGGKTYLGTRKYYTEKYVNQKLQLGITEKEVDYITGCYFVVKSDVLKKYGVLTERFFFGEEDYEFCNRMKKNKVKLMVLLNEKIYHKVGASINKNSASGDIMKKSFIHHLNRFIDMREYYNYFIWNIWRVFSSIYIFVLMRRISKQKLKEVYQYVRLLNFYSKQRDNVDKDFFTAVLSGKII